jgi:hypothetical protein
VSQREPDVGHADLEEAPGRLPRLAEFDREELEPFDSDRGQQPPLIPEMVARRRVGHPNASGELAKAQLSRTVLGDFGQGCIEERTPKVAVVIGASR